MIDEVVHNQPSDASCHVAPAPLGPSEPIPRRSRGYGHTHRATRRRGSASHAGGHPAVVVGGVALEAEMPSTATAIGELAGVATGDVS
jgi:hypothetical protein